MGKKKTKTFYVLHCTHNSDDCCEKLLSFCSHWICVLFWKLSFKSFLMDILERLYADWSFKITVVFAKIFVKLNFSSDWLWRHKHCVGNQSFTAESKQRFCKSSSDSSFKIHFLKTNMKHNESALTKITLKCALKPEIVSVFKWNYALYLSTNDKWIVINLCWWDISPYFILVHWVLVCIGLLPYACIRWTISYCYSFE